MKSLKIGQVAKAVNLTVEGVRFYEKIGLIPTVERAKSGHRMYRQETVGRILFVQKMQPLGFQLDEIREILAQVDQDWGNRNCLANVLNKQISHLEKNWKMLTRTKALLGSNGQSLESSSEFFHEFQKLQLSQTT